MDKFTKLHADRAAQRDAITRAELTAEITAGVAPEIAALLGTAAAPATELPELTQALRQCTPRQRIVLRAFAENAFVIKRTAYALGLKPETVSTMLRKPALAACREIMEKMAAETIGVTAASTIARINDIVEGSMIVDPAVALRGLETLARITKAVPVGGGGVQVGVQVMIPVEERYSDVRALPGVRVIDAEFSEIK